MATVFVPPALRVVKKFLTTVDTLVKNSRKNLYLWAFCCVFIHLYYIEYDTDEDFVQWLYEDDTFNIPHWVVIDWEAMARSIMLDYFESSGHYFKS